MRTGYTLPGAGARPGFLVNADSRAGRDHEDGGGALRRWRGGEFVLPDVGEGLADVEVLKWMVGVGEPINENDLLAEIETDKAVVQDAGARAGGIVELRTAEGERIAVGAVWLVMGEVAGETDEGRPRSGPRTPSETGAADGGGGGGRTGVATAPRGDGAVRASPVARKTAEILGVDLAEPWWVLAPAAESR